MVDLDELIENIGKRFYMYYSQAFTRLFQFPTHAVSQLEIKEPFCDANIGFRAFHPAGQGLAMDSSLKHYSLCESY